MDTLSQIIRLHEDDDVAIARNTLPAGTVLNELDGLLVRAEIPAAHKVAPRDVEGGALVRRYGQTIGRASCRIERVSTSMCTTYRWTISSAITRLAQT